MSKRQTLRTMVNQKRGLVAPGAYDGVSARLIERAGFEAVYMTGNGTSASRLGLPDFGFAGLGEMTDQARNLALTIDLPLIADADTGYGNALNVRRTVQAYEAAGVAALHIEDQALPKRCGLLDGKEVVAVTEFAQKIRAAVEARTDPDLLIIARTDAIAVNGFEDAMRRAEAAALAGADLLFIQGPETVGQVQTIAGGFDLPLLYNFTPASGQPLISITGLRELGFALIILPLQPLLIAAAAVEGFLAGLRQGEVPSDYSGRALSLGAFNHLIGVEEQLALGERYAG